MFDDLLGRVSIFGQAVSISRGTCGISTHAISYQVKAAMFVFAHVENHTGVAVALAASLRGWNLVRNCQVCASAATSVSWPARLFFWPRRAFPWSARGPFFSTSETNSGPRQEPKKGTKMDPQIGPAKKENMLFESKLGVHFGSPKFGVREPSHTACRGRPAASLFVSVSRRQEYGQ